MLGLENGFYVSKVIIVLLQQRSKNEERVGFISFRCASKDDGFLVDLLLIQVLYFNHS